MHSYAHPGNEERVAGVAKSVLADLGADIPVSLSSDVSPEFREYERAITTVLNSYLGPVMRRYLSSLEVSLRDVPVTATLQVVRSDGGLMSVAGAQAHPIATALSGPSGGVNGAAFVAKRAGFDKIITFDMGGTSSDVAVCIGGVPEVTRETHVAAFPVRAPAIRVETIGAGGGSIANVSEVTGGLRVGPESAGAQPGPACYGRGGELPTVTDANLVLGHLTATLLGGDMLLDRDAAIRAHEPLAAQLGVDVYRAAQAVVDIVNGNMLGALRVATVQKGLNPREFSLLSFGGAGGLHANALASELGCFPVIVPPEAGVLSALGFVVADVRNEFAQAFMTAVDTADAVALRGTLRDLGRRAGAWLEAEGVPAGERSVRYVLDMRYRRQGYEIPVEIDAETAESLELETLTTAFPRRTRPAVRIPAARARGTRHGALPRDRSHREGGSRTAAGGAGRSPPIPGRHPGLLVRRRAARHPGLRPCADEARHARGGKSGDHAVRLDDSRPARPRRTGRPLVQPADRGGAMTTRFDIDPITLDLIENALKNIRAEMDEVLRRSAMSSSIREQHDEFPMIANERGQMIVGQFGSYIPDVVRQFEGRIGPGDAIILNDPYLCRGSISHTNDVLVIVPIYHDGNLAGYASQFGHVLDMGGRAAGTQSADALSVWDEGLRIPPVKLVEAGVLNEGLLALILNNTRVPDIVRSDIMGLIGACQRAASRVVELCDRYGHPTYSTACEALLDRTRQAMIKLVRRYISEEKVTFWDWVDDDGLGNGPFKLQLTVWRAGDKAYFDWTGTDPQAPGSINFLIHENLCKLFFGVYMIMAFDSSILFNDGYNEVFEVVLPAGSLLNPKFPAPLSNRLNVHTRLFDCISGALGQKAPDLSMAAWLRHQPVPGLLRQ